MTMNRCTGHCCKKFYLPLTPDQIKEELELSKTRPPRFQDFAKIAAMVIPIEPTTGMTGAPLRAEDVNHYYTCIHYDEQSGDCKNYEDRPTMCKDYPYGRPCNVVDCTSDCIGVG